MRIPWIAAPLALGVLAAAVASGDQKPPAHDVPATSKDGDVVVGLCDGVTSLEVKGLRPGQTLDRAGAQNVSDGLMREWRKKNPGAEWEDAPMLAQTADPSHQGQLPNSPLGLKPTAPPTPPPASAVQQGHTYGAYGARDEAIWRASTQAFVDEGNQIFHDANRLGGTVGISCDMCHPDGANTHPETYPKFQVQLGRVALLRDMINWCIENPVRGKPLADGDDRLRALEAYIYAQRRGVPLEYGKH